MDQSFEPEAERAAERDKARRYLLILAALWAFFYASWALFTPALLDDADSVHAEVAREMVQRGDWITLYANGIRYLEKAPVLYWSMAASMQVFGPYAAAARLPLALMVFALALAAFAFANRAFRSARAGFYAAIILLSSFGIFIFSRILLPDIGVCLWLTLSMLCFWLNEQRAKPSHWLAAGFGAACALNVLTKGLIGLVFPIGIVLCYLIYVYGLKGGLRRAGQHAPWTALLVFFVIASPWHILAGLANPTQGHPGELTWQHGHWFLAEPTRGNVHGWYWFYFVNEHLLRYLNLRVPRDYDTVPLLLFWGLLFVWLMPWSAFAFKAVGRVPFLAPFFARILDSRERTRLFLGIWAVIPLLFFSFSTRQEYYVLPSLPALALLVAEWLHDEASEAETFATPNPLSISGLRVSAMLFAVGTVITLVCGYILLNTRTPAPNVDLASLLQQNPEDYALSFGHFLDLNATAMGAFRGPLGLTAVTFAAGTFLCWWNRRESRPHTSNMWLAAMAFVFLIAAHTGLRFFAPVLSSYRLAEALQPELKPTDILVIHGEYEAGSTLGFYLQRNNIHIFEGHSANLWYGSFFNDAPPIFEDEASLKAKWRSQQRVFLWTESNRIPSFLGNSYLVIENGGKQILCNHPKDQ